MASTSKALVFRMKLDDSKFTKGMKLTSAEVRMFKRELDATLTPAEKATIKMKKFDAVVSKAGPEMKQYATSIKRVRDRLKGAGTEAKKTGGLFSGMSADMKGLAVGGAIVLGIKKFFDVIKAGARIAIKFVGDLVSQFGILDEQINLMQKGGISAEAFGAAQILGGKAGLNAKDIAKAFAKLTVNISDAVVGLGEAKDILPEIGLEAKKRNLLSAANQYKVVADAIKGLTNRNDQLRIATKLFGRQGALMINVIRQGGEAFDAAAKDAEAYGLVLNKTEQEDVGGVAGALKELELIGVGIWTRLAAAAAPSFKPIIEDLKRIGISLVKFIDEHQPEIEAFLNRVAGLVDTVADGFVSWVDNIDDVVLALKPIAKLIQLIPNPLQPAGDVVVGFADGIIAKRKKAAAEEEASEATAKAAKEQADADNKKQIELAEQAERDRKKALQQSEKLARQLQQNSTSFRLVTSLN